MPNLQVFTARRGPHAGQPGVTIHRKGTVALNRPAYEQLGKPDAVELLYDLDERVIGFRPVDPAVPHAYPIRPQRGRQSTVAPTYVINAATFIEYIGYQSEVAQRFSPTTADGAMLVQLNEGRASPRRGGRAHAEAVAATR